jgi:FMN phosphatase YigB (HAD superfamily)
MAIKTNEGLYIKIDFDNCMVKGDSVVARVVYYENEKERQKEKERASDIEQFFKELWKQIQREKAKENHEKASELEWTYRVLYDGLYNYRDIPEVEKKYLYPLGFKAKWITDRPKIVTIAEIGLGEYDGEKVEHAFYYDRLKGENGLRLPLSDC